MRNPQKNMFAKTIIANVQVQVQTQGEGEDTVKIILCSPYAKKSLDITKTVIPNEDYSECEKNLERIINCLIETANENLGEYEDEDGRYRISESGEDDETQIYLKVLVSKRTMKVFIRQENKLINITDCLCSDTLSDVWYEIEQEIEAQARDNEFLELAY